jgi:predicted dehydrogenase
MIKIGVLGAGHLGKIHIRLLREIPAFELLGFYDPDDKNAQQVINEFQLKRFESQQELIEAVDAVDVVTPTIHHFDGASRALRLSKHVFIEKPVTHTMEEAKALTDLAYEANVSVQVGHVERFNPAFIAAQQYQLRPMFIETHRLAEFNPRGTDVSVILDLMIHDIDITLSVVRSNVKKISASGVAVVSDTTDIANARIEFDNGCVANLTASRISMKSMRKTRFFQRDAYIAMDFLKKTTEVFRLEEAGDNVHPMSIVLEMGEGRKNKIIHYESPKTGLINAIKMELELFADSIIYKHNPPVTLADGVDALNIAHQVLEKIELNKTV